MKFKIGDIAYPAYIPAQAGKVVAVQETYPGAQKVTIRTPKGKEVTTSSAESFIALIEDHRAKLKRHEERLKLIELMGV